MKRVAMAVFGVALALGGATACKRSAPEPTMNAAAALGVDPRDSALAAFILDSGNVMIAAARGQPHDGRWDGFDATRDLRATDPTSVMTMSSYGTQARLVVVAMELEGVGRNPSMPGAPGWYLRSTVLVFPDGRVRWTGVETRAESYPQTTVNMAVLNGAAPQLGSGFNRLIDTLRGPCNLPLLTPNDAAVLPPGAQAEVQRSPERLPAACATVRGATMATWEPRLDDITVLMQTPMGQWLQVRSQFHFDGPRMFLEHARVRLR